MDVGAKKQELMRRRAALIGDLSEIEHALDAPLPPDWEDRASERQGDEVLEALGHADLTELKRIDAALVRIADGTYGRCMACEQPISDARLDVVPDAALCRFCA
jgi:RNA polymerase-binding transcription factor DksA